MLAFLHRIALGFLFASSCNLSAVEIVAHRGASADAPENTLSAMKLAWEQNADAIELDLWLSKDGKLAVFHDADTKRYNGKTNKVASLSRDELEALDVGALKGAKFKGERMPTLESILVTIPQDRRAYLEIKCGPEILPELERVLLKAGTPHEKLAVISFNFDSVKESKKLFPNVPHYFLHSYKKDPATGALPELPVLIQRCKEAKLDGLDLHYDWPIDKEFVSRVKGAGLKLLAWTVNNAAIAKRLVEAGVDGITTDRPGWLKQQLGPRPVTKP